MSLNIEKQLFTFGIRGCVRPVLGLLVVACSLTLASCAQRSATPAQMHIDISQQRQQQTISQSRGAAAAAGHAVRERAPAATAAAASAPKSMPSAKLTALDAESATDGIAALMEPNFLESLQSGQQSQQQQQQQQQQQSQTTSPAPTQSVEISDANSLQTLKSILSKTRRQVDKQQQQQQIKSADWWTKLAHKNRRADRKADENRQHSKTSAATSPAAVYREQPLSQNALLTIRHQLVAIRDKHRSLMQKSVPQLMQLDQKLVDSYKLCLKRKMPLYAGMLYRTRDYVVRMANEVRHERQVLEAMTKQIQKVLRHKMTNRTLIKEFNRQSATMATTMASLVAGSSGAKQSALDLSAHERPLQQLLGYELASSSPTLSTAGDPLQFGTRLARRSLSPSAAQSGPSSALARGVFAPSRRDESQASQLNERDLRPQPVYDILPPSAQQLPHKTRHTPPAAPLPPKTRLASSGLDGEDQLTFASESEQLDVDNFDLFTKSLAGHSTHTSSISVITTSTTTTTTTSTAATPTSTTSTRRPRPKTYAVHINEVNLKRELVKTQALIDRINASTHELMSVADDIVYLFKLTSGDTGSRAKGLSASGKINRFELLGSDQKRAKKVTLKSPFKTLLERYGKLTMAKSGIPSATTIMATATLSPSATTLSDISLARSAVTNEINLMTNSPLMDINTNNPPEMRPLFEPAEIATFKDPVDIELGFDAPATLEI